MQEFADEAVMPKMKQFGVHIGAGGLSSDSPYLNRQRSANRRVPYPVDCVCPPQTALSSGPTVRRSGLNAAARLDTTAIVMLGDIHGAVAQPVLSSPWLRAPNSGSPCGDGAQRRPDKSRV